MSNYERRKTLPYGKWTCGDGREILFGRSYIPLHQRLASGEVSEADRNERVPFVKQEWFYTDSTPEQGKLRAAQGGLVAWGYA
jgi:hypothetical protein